MEMIARKLDDRSGQGTVEFAVAFPVMLVIAVIVMNALLFFSECASYDRLASQAVRTVATSPSYGQTVYQSAAQVDALIDGEIEEAFLSSQIVASATSEGFTSFTATLEFSPTLFGLGVWDQVLGVPLPKLHHSVRFVVDPYHPGILS